MFTTTTTVGREVRQSASAESLSLLTRVYLGACCVDDRGWNKNSYPTVSGVCATRKELHQLMHGVIVRHAKVPDNNESPVDNLSIVVPGIYDDAPYMHGRELVINNDDDVTREEGIGTRVECAVDCVDHLASMTRNRIKRKHKKHAEITKLQQ